MALETKNRARLLELLFNESFRYSAEGSFQLSSGKKTSYYIDCKKVSLDAEGATLIGREIFERIKGLPVAGVGGMTLGADPIATAISVISFLENHPIQAFIVRKTPKTYGSKQQIEGNLHQGAKVVVVEDVVTTGGSTLRTVEALENAGYTVLKIIALVDRKEGGREAIAKTGIPFESLFTIDDFTGRLS